jgi:hypothetical protein
MYFKVKIYKETKHIMNTMHLGNTAKVWKDRCSVVIQTRLKIWSREIQTSWFVLHSYSRKKTFNWFVQCKWLKMYESISNIYPNK